MKVMMKILPPRYELLVVPEGYVMDEETARDFLACRNRTELKKLLAKWSKSSLNDKVKPDPDFATSPIFLLIRIMNSLLILI